MREIYHRLMAKLHAWWRIIVNIPAAIRWDDEDINRVEMLRLVGRIGRSNYYQKYAKEVACGCYAIGTHYTSYSSSCELHMKWLFEMEPDN